MPELHAILDGQRWPVKISECDSYLKRWTWRLTHQGHVYRNFSFREKGKRRCRRIYLHRLIMGLGQGDERCVDHLNNNPTDNRRENLEVVSKAENVRRAYARQAAGGEALRVYERGEVWLTE